MLKIGITGFMGSGKTYIANLFAKKGVPVYNCDKGSKNLVMNNADLILAIKAEFGEDIYSGESVFKNLSKIVFIKGDKTRLNKLMSIISPFIQADMERFYAEHKDHKFCLVESAILYENKMEEKLDKVIYVSCPEEIGMRRAIERDGITEQDYKNRMEDQISSIDKIKMSEHIIYNADFGDTEQSVNEIYDVILYLIDRKEL
jgi:dephospho-CoA kinase